FLLESLEDLDRSLRQLKSRLFVVRGQPTDVFSCLFKKWNITRLTFEHDSEPYCRERDATIVKMAHEHGVETCVRHSNTLYMLSSIIAMNHNKPPLTFKRFKAIVQQLGLPKSPLATVSRQQMETCSPPLSAAHDQQYGVLSLDELGFKTDGLTTAVWKGGETEALMRLDKKVSQAAVFLSSSTGFLESRTLFLLHRLNVDMTSASAPGVSPFPCAQGWLLSESQPRRGADCLFASPTGLTPYIRFGCLSCRTLYFTLRELYMKTRKNGTPPFSLYSQLMWREFFYTTGTDNPHFDRMVGNPVCVQIPWDHDAEALAKWAQGRTGFPWIDAVMTQLRQEGWVHHLARHAVACFLTRGDLWLSWECGMKVFDELLLDGDWSINAGSWMWVSCSAFFQQFFHCYCPVGFGRRIDPSGAYIRHYLPQLAGYPDQYIHEPWSAPDWVQKEAKCVVGVDYPRPMVDHGQRSRLNIERMKQVYQQISSYKGLREAEFSCMMDTSEAPSGIQGTTEALASLSEVRKTVTVGMATPGEIPPVRKRNFSSVEEETPRKTTI
ncbi:hypothetical protein CRUP_000372, partial [Coryphaenoides rupestris]